MGVIATFNYGLWTSQFPALAPIVNQAQAQAYFDLATTIHRNDGGGPVNNVATQLNLLNMLTAHLAQLFTPPAPGQQPSTIVGRINSATQGSVSVQAAYSTNVGQQMAWFIQTPAGAMYWTATAPYRTMRYRPNRRTGVVPIGPPGFGV
jgi:hypothetical protein